MRPFFCIWLGLLLGLASFNPIQAAPPAKLSIDQIRVGFQSVTDSTGTKAGAGIFKTAAWTSVRVDVTNGPDVLGRNDYLLVTESTDGDDMPFQYTERRLLPTLQPGEQITLMTYVKPGTAGSEITVSVRSADGRTTFATSKARRDDFDAMPTNMYLCLDVGSKLPALNNALNRKPGSARGENDEGEALPEDGPTKLVTAETVEQLPTRWIGYVGIDLVVLTSGSERLVSELAGDRTGRKEALAEWVRRGGRLLVSVGHNHQFVNGLLVELDLIKCPIGGSVSQPRLVLENKSESLPRDPGILQDKPGRGKASHPIELALLKPQLGVDVLMTAEITPSPNKSEKAPVLVQSSCGLGRVMLVAFDVDQPPFTNWEGQERFWTALAQDLGLRLPSASAQNANKGSLMRSELPELGTLLADDLEAFDDIPVVSFGWVALFIVIYIIVVGPLDYWFLKKVVKRLELTWITFPAVVLSVSAAAYFAAYYLKGNDLKVNKIDIVDIDLANSKIYGSTWFTIFSPRIQNYTVGIEPSQTGWSSASGSQVGPGSLLVEAFDRPETPMGDRSRTGSQGLFSRNYRYDDEMAGLEGVPVQVWSTKSFAASWQNAISSKAIESNLHPADSQSDQLVGEITNNLPVPLQDAVLVFRERAYPVGSMELGSSKQVHLLKGEKASQLLSVDFLRASKSVTSAKPDFGTGGRTQNLSIKSVLFFGAGARTQYGNSGLRYLDENWRVRPDHSGEAVLIARASPAHGPAEKITESAVSPSQLWLGRLPGSNAKRPELVGTLSQETYIRVYIPVKP
ncbi:MAG: hypothetical protein ACJ8FY_25325 [Gemmataceae bacterium]